MITIHKKKAAVMTVLAVAIAVMFAGPIALGSQSHHASAFGHGGFGHGGFGHGGFGHGGFGGGWGGGFGGGWGGCCGWDDDWDDCDC